jgi:hypothetical protein
MGLQEFEEQIIALHVESLSRSTSSEPSSRKLKGDRVPESLLCYPNDIMNLHSATEEHFRHATKLIMEELSIREVIRAMEGSSSFDSKNDDRMYSDVRIIFLTSKTIAFILSGFFCLIITLRFLSERKMI